MEPFRYDNTEGYTESDLLEINAEWWGFCDDHNLVEYTDTYESERKNFCDNIARR